MKDSVVIFDGTSYFVESVAYTLQKDEEVVFTGSFSTCEEKCDILNYEAYLTPRNTRKIGL